MYSQVFLNGGDLKKTLSDLEAFDNVYKAHGSRKGCPAFPQVFIWSNWVKELGPIKGPWAKQFLSPWCP